MVHEQAMRANLMTRFLIGALVAGFFSAGLGAAPAAAQVAPAPAGFESLSERLMPAVVNIATSASVEGAEDLPRFPRGSPLERFNDLFGEQGPREVSSLGSGFIISADGVVVTNNHVIEGAEQIEIIFQDGERLKATVVGRDPATDIAVLRVKAGRPLPFVRFGDSGNARVGSWVIAIGNPFGLGASVSAGIVSARNRNIDAGRYDDFIQTDAAINRGNSGGPLFNMAGEVIGVNTAIVSPTGGSVGVGFATPSDLAKSVVDQLLQFGETRRGWLGVRIGTVTPDVARRNNLPRPRGALIASVTEGGPAARAGIRPGDLIMVYDGKEIIESRNLTRLVADTQINRAVAIEYLRGGKRLSTTATILRLDEGRLAALGEGPTTRPPEGSGVGAPGAQLGRLMGMTLSEITRDLRKQYALSDDVKGLIVVGIDAGSDAAAKLELGDVIVEMAFEPVETIGQARALAARAERGGGRPLLLYILRDGEATFRSVRNRR
jgi:serine protease Do